MSFNAKANKAAKDAARKEALRKDVDFVVRAPLGRISKRQAPDMPPPISRLWSRLSAVWPHSRAPDATGRALRGTRAAPPDHPRVYALGSSG
jgi:hypothetical protein